MSGRADNNDHDLDDPLADICPICGLPIEDNEEWTRIWDGAFAHTQCAEPCA